MRSLITYACLLCAAGAFLSSCYHDRWRNYDNNPPVRDEAYVPIYADDSIGAKVVTSLPARKTVVAGKIYVQGHLLFQVENLTGVHVIDYTDKAHPVKLGFIKSRGCSEVAYKNGYLMINNMSDLVFIDVRDPAQVKEVARIQSAFHNFYVQRFRNDRPPLAGKYYVCPDFNKGDIVGWELQKNVHDANCSY